MSDRAKLFCKPSFSDATDHRTTLSKVSVFLIRLRGIGSLFSSLIFSDPVRDKLVRKSDLQ